MDIIPPFDPVTLYCSVGQHRVEPPCDMRKVLTGPLAGRSICASCRANPEIYVGGRVGDWT